MNNNRGIVVLEKPDTSNFIVYGQNTSSQYITYKNDNSLVPSSLDQIMKNNIVVFVPESKELIRSESSGKPY